MSRRLRFLPPGSLVEVTSRTLQGRFLLQPTHQVAELCRGVLARAARLYPVEVHAFAFLGNHYHLLLTIPDAQRLAAFMNYLNSNLAREVGRAVRWRERFWGRRYQAIPVSNEEPAQVERLLYILRQGCKEGLVQRPSDWPGATSVRSLLTGEPVTGPWFDRTLEYNATRGRKSRNPGLFFVQETLELTPLPCWKNRPRAAVRRWIAELVRGVELGAAQRLETTGREAMGPDRLARQNPHEAANRMKRSPAPLFHAASKESRKTFRESYRQFVREFRVASEKFRSKRGLSERFELFPAGSFPPPGPFLTAT